MVEIGNGDQRAEDHFVGSDQMPEMGKGDQRMELFKIQVPGINKHLKNIFDSKKLVEDSVVSILETTPADGKNYQTHACYLVIQNADPAKEIVAQGQQVATHTPATGTASSGPGQGGLVTATMLTASSSAARN